MPAVFDGGTVGVLLRPSFRRSVALLSFCHTAKIFSICMGESMKKAEDFCRRKQILLDRQIFFCYNTNTNLCSEQKANERIISCRTSILQTLSVIPALLDGLVVLLESGRVLYVKHSSPPSIPRRCGTACLNFVRCLPLRW